MTLVDSLYCTKRLLRNQRYEPESKVRSNVKPIPVYRAAHLLPYISFLRAAGAPVERHLRQARLPVLLADEPGGEAALQLLGDPDMKIIDVAYATGYEDPSNFARAFRRLTGVNPQEYRLQQAA